MLLRELAGRLAKTRPDDVAVIENSARRTWADLADRAERLGGAMQTLGLRKGDRAGIISHDRVEMLDHWHACLRTGLVRVGLNWRYSPAEMDHIVTDADIRLVVVQNTFVPALQERITRWRAAGRLVVGFGGDHGLDLDLETLVAGHTGGAEHPPLEPEDPIVISYTSGSTGTPKGVVLTQQGGWAQLFSSPYAGGFRKDDVILNNLPGSGFPIFIHSFPMSVGATAVMPGLFDADRTIDVIRRHGVTIMFAVPTMLNAIEQRARARSLDLPSLRLVITLGSPVVPAIVERARARFGCEFQNWYGSTEANGAIAMLRPADIDPEDPADKTLESSVGLPLLHVDVEIHDDEDREVPPGVVGEICVRGPVMKEYHNLPDETSHAWRNDWFHLGDLGYRDERGRIFLSDRKHFMIISGGYNVFPAVVENVIADHPGVAEVAVVGAPHPRWGEAVVAVVVPVAGTEVSAEQIAEFCRPRLGKWEIPKHVDFVERLPVGSTGKIQKTDLRSRYSESPERLPWADEF